jgi:ABC-type multidrug transport system ATPase subunit
MNLLLGIESHTGGVTKVNGVPGSLSWYEIMCNSNLSALPNPNILSRYRKIIGYVPQDDIILPELTVRENILHSLRLHFPSTWTDNEIEHHVDIVINCLQLSRVTYSLFGRTAALGISGGARKRVSIGTKLAAAS